MEEIPSFEWFNNIITKKYGIQPSVVCSIRGDVLSLSTNSCWEIPAMTGSPQKTEKRLHTEKDVILE